MRRYRYRRPKSAHLQSEQGKPLAVRHQPASDEFYVCGALEVQCESLDDVMAVIAEGHLNRRRASHDLNQDSSR